MILRAPGDHLRRLRLRLGITTREVESLSLKIAEQEKNPEFQLSNAWLTQIENSDSVPSIYKLYSLAAIYHVKFTDLLLYFGVDLQKVAHHQLSAQLANTHLTNLEVYDVEKTVSFPVRFDRSFDLDNTNLLTRMVEIWGEVPIARLQQLDLRHNLYGYIGLQDFTLHPLLRPGTFVQVDQRVRRIQPQRLAHGIRPADLLRGVAGGLRVFVVRASGRPFAAFTTSAFALQRSQS